MPQEFIPSLSLDADGSTAPAIWFVVRGMELLIRIDDHERYAVPVAIEIEAVVKPLEPHVLGTLDGRPVLTAEVPANFEPPDRTIFVGIRKLFETLDPILYGLAGRALQIVEWDRTHRFCGRCGAAMEPMAGQRAKRCPACELLRFPRLDPSVIVLVERAGKVLLARNATYTPGYFSVLAGFVDQGETLEDAARREVREEVGIELGEIRYFGSQPWPFPHGLMIGFIAEWASGELEPNPGELDEAGWFAPDELPALPGKISIARDLVDDFVHRTRGQ